MGLHQGTKPAGPGQQALNQCRRQAAASLRQAAGDDVRAGRDCGQAFELRLGRKRAAIFLAASCAGGNCAEADSDAEAGFN